VLGDAMKAGPRVSRGEPLHHQVARNVRNLIEAGRLKDGEALPSTREMAEQWGVSVFTITEAMKILAAEGLVESRSRSKRVVRSRHGTTGQRSRPERPRVVLIGGYAGSGKSELARILARLTGWAVLDKDTITRPVVETALEVLGCSPHDRESEQYLTRVRPREYEALAAATLENVECGNSVVSTAPFLKEFRDLRWIQRSTALLDSHGADVSFVWIYCDAETMHGYIRHRSAARDAAKLADWPAYLAGVDLEFRPPVPHTLIDNSSSSIPLQTQAGAFLETLTAVSR
jgi:DNA-binding transcriptional regulator YhcF (GntR family)/predicted kinase